ncbi:kinase-like domain-containing protein [Gigaspora margarita]|uniref:Kinase-like domain-containing protein n=1 Tax=Gigaspora margarita TaxID=4874 RepID=A0A8H3WV94_GIGMA|nr:kinase-like domain-containing protein [Gigaspora margarita]
MKCWDTRPNNRPTSEEIYDIIRIWNNDVLEDNSTEIVAQIKECEEISNNFSPEEYYYKTHPEAKYTSQFIEYTNHRLPLNALDYDEKHEVLDENIQYLKEKDDDLMIACHVERN